MRLGIDRSEAVSLMTEANWLIEVLTLTLRILCVVLASHHLEVVLELLLCGLFELSLNAVGVHGHASLQVELGACLIELVVGHTMAGRLVEILDGILSLTHTASLVEKGLVVDAGALVVTRLWQVPRLVPSFDLGGAWQVNTIFIVRNLINLPWLETIHSFFNYI